MNLGDFWVEKYRPSTLDELCITPDVREQIKSYGMNIPNLLFCGVQGTGKTSLAKIIVNNILDCDYLYVNASEENGIDNIRTKVTGFAQTRSLDGNLKVIILDEADYLSKEAQAALRNLMESYARTTRFILTGNYKHKIIPALQSRCQGVTLRPILKDSLKRCLYILDKENIEVSQEQKVLMANLVRSYFPDLRKAINEVQKFCIDGVLSIKKKTNTNQLVELIFKNIQSKKSLETRKHLIENDQLFDGDHEQLLKDLLNHYYTQEIPDTEKKQSILTIADHLFKIVHVTDREICAFACLLQLENL